MKKSWLLIPFGTIALLAVKYSRFWLPPVIATITSKFGSRINPITKKTEFHNGIDLSVPVGTSIRSPYKGIVDKVYTNDLGGLQLIVKHANGFRTGYAHLSKVYFAVGDSVRRGDILALSGRSGNVTGAHLHFVLVDPSGKPVDPELFIYKA